MNAELKNARWKNSRLRIPPGNRHECLSFRQIFHKLMAWDQLHHYRTGEEHLFQNYYSECAIGPELFWAIYPKYIDPIEAMHLVEDIGNTIQDEVEEYPPTAHAHHRLSTSSLSSSTSTTLTSSTTKTFNLSLPNSSVDDSNSLSSIENYYYNVEDKNLISFDKTCNKRFFDDSDDEKLEKLGIEGKMSSFNSNIENINSLKDKRKRYI
ncbi:expressed protein [Phakopsora pachyrhizi]|uniref:Expressed protein n=1 Tax=Phakopsora pachyrhizi TaxID=170000 RepID=A0AAV0BGX7_PHAPC|nr:expressed protein [Phakopsora pachyrhizi]